MVEQPGGKLNQLGDLLAGSRGTQFAAKRLWLIGGTRESAQLAAEIAHTSLACTITVTTASAKSLYPQADNIRIWVGEITSDKITAFIQQEAIRAILDASHPFAVAVSKLAIATAQGLGIPYLRYERPRIGEEGKRGRWGEGEMGRRGEIGIEEGKIKSEIQNPKSKIQNSLILDSFEALLASDHLAGKRVLLTVGYRPLALFRPWQTRSLLFARISPSLVGLEAALAAGFTPDRLIALRPPISAAIEQALWRQWNISLVVTKASGQAGGEDIKRKIAAMLGIQLVIINRPAMSYPQQTSQLTVALSFCHEVLEKVDLKGMPSIR